MTPDATDRHIPADRAGSPPPPARRPRSENLWWLGSLLWPFVAGAVAINLFLLGLIVRSADWGPAMTPVAALLWSLPLSVPATWAAAVWVRSLIREAEGR